MGQKKHAVACRRLRTSDDKAAASYQATVVRMRNVVQRLRAQHCNMQTERNGARTLYRRLRSGL